MVKRLIEGEFPITCTGCCLICDDIELSQDSGGALIIKNACQVCHDDLIGWYSTTQSTLSTSDIAPEIEKANSILAAANLPLVCGLTDQSVETQQAAVELARRCNAAIDWTNGHWPFAFQDALQDTGLVSCTFGEIKERADLVIYWSCTDVNPAFTRRFVQDTKTIRIDWDQTKQATAIRFLRQHPSDTEVDWEVDGDQELTELKQAIDSAIYPVIVIDDAAAETLGESGVLSMVRFVRAQNARNHCRLVHYSARQNVTGIQSTLSALAAGPYGVTFRNGKPMFRNREFTTESLLGKGLVDALVLIGSPAQLPDIDLPKGMPVIWFSDGVLENFAADVTIPFSRWGMDCDGTGYRDDGVPVFRKQVFERLLPTSIEVLSEVG